MIVLLMKQLGAIPLRVFTYLISSLSGYYASSVILGYLSTIMKITCLNIQKVKIGPLYKIVASMYKLFPGLSISP